MVEKLRESPEERTNALIQTLRGEGRDIKLNMFGGGPFSVEAWQEGIGRGGKKPPIGSGGKMKREGKLSRKSWGPSSTSESQHHSGRGKYIQQNHGCRPPIQARRGNHGLIFGAVDKA